MKRIIKNILLIFVVATLVFAFASCSALLGDKEQELLPDPGPDAKIAYCEKLNALIAQSYSAVNLTVTTASSNTILTSGYTFNNDNTVSYSIEKIASFKLVGGKLVAPDSYKEKVEGIATVAADKNTVNVDGDFIQLPSYTTLTGKFTFDPQNLNNFAVSDGTASFSVADASAFIGDASLTGMTVSVSYSDIAITSITINATYENASVVYAYTFGNAIN